MKNSMDNAGDMLVKRVEQLIIEARQKVAVAVNTTMVYTYYEIGRMIVENEQNGQERAEYGKAVLNKLSAHLTQKFGKGFSQRNLEQMRQFFLIYEKKRIKSADTVCAFSLSWSSESACISGRRLSILSTIGVILFNSWSLCEPNNLVTKLI